MMTSKTFSSFSSSSSYRHRFHDEKKFNKRLSFFKRINKRNNKIIIETSSSLNVNGFNDNKEGFSNEKYSEDVERKYNYDNTYNKNDDYDNTKNRRKEFYRMNPSDDDDFDENNNNNNNNKNIRPAKEKKRKTVAD